MSKAEHVTSWRRRTKKRSIDAFGGICCLCKKEYPQEVFEFHHLNPSEKSFGLGKIRCLAWERICEELRKCVLVCANCHRLIEYGHAEVPYDAYVFNESYLNYKEQERQARFDKCVCGRSKPKIQKYCSPECAHFNRRKVDRPDIKTLKRLLKNYSLNHIGKMYGVSHAAVKKWKVSYNI